MVSRVWFRPELRLALREIHAEDVSFGQLETSLRGGNGDVCRHDQIDRLRRDVTEREGCTVDEVVN